MLFQSTFQFHDIYVASVTSIADANRSGGACKRFLGCRPGEVGLYVPEEVESQLARLLLPRHMLAVLGLPQLVCEGHCQVVLPDVLLHLPSQSIINACN